MPDDRVAVREIAWLEIFPWLILLRTFRIARQPMMLAVAAAGVLLTYVGFVAIGYVFSGDTRLDDQVQALTESPLHWVHPGRSDTLSAPPANADGTSSMRQFADAMAPMPTPPATLASDAARYAPKKEAFDRFLSRNVSLYWPWERLSRPFRELFAFDLTISGFAFHFLAAVWVTAVWSLCGGILARTAAMQLAAEEKISLRRAVGHVQAKWKAYFLGPVGTMLVVLVIVLLVGLAGLIMRWDVGLLLGAIAWPIVLLLGVLGTLILGGLAFGWPLMWAAVGVENSDTYDALSRSFTYVLSRPLHFLFYLLVAAAIGTLGWLAAAAFGEMVIYLGAWSASRGQQLGQIMAVVSHPWPWANWPPADTNDVSAIGAAGLHVIRFWCAIVHLLVVGFVFSYFWTAACGCYLLLRYNVDGNELDDIAMDEHEEPHELPPLGTDEHGVPTAPNDAGDPEAE